MYKAATLTSDTFDADGAWKTVRLNCPGMTASNGSWLEYHAQRSASKPSGIESNWPSTSTGSIPKATDRTFSNIARIAGFLRSCPFQKIWRLTVYKWFMLGEMSDICFGDIPTTTSSPEILMDMTCCRRLAVDQYEE